MTRRFDVRDAHGRSRGVAAAVTAAKRGRVVLLPTESVYALLADAFSAHGVAAVRTAKQRPDSSALPVAVSSVRMLRGIAERLPGHGQALVDAFWPGPLTLVCRQQPSLQWFAAGSGRALTVRMPLHPVALDVIDGVGPSVLIAAGGLMALDPAAEGADPVDVVLDAGARTSPGQASTVVDVRGDRPVLVREGALSHRRLVDVVGPLLDAAAPGAPPTVVPPTEGDAR